MYLLNKKAVNYCGLRKRLVVLCEINKGNGCRFLAAPLCRGDVNRGQGQLLYRCLNKSNNIEVDPAVPVIFRASPQQHV